MLREHDGHATVDGHRTAGQPVPAPRGTIGTPAAVAALTIATTSSVDRGKHDRGRAAGVHERRLVEAVALDVAVASRTFIPGS